MEFSIKMKIQDTAARFFSHGSINNKNPICQVQTIADDETKKSRSTTRIIIVAKKRSECLAKSTLRRYLLITLNHAEKGNRSLLMPNDLINRLNNVFRCKSIIVSRECHKENGYHFHVGVWTDSASKNTLNRTIREIFPEFEGRQCNVSTHRVWGTVCQYVLKEDKNPVVWGEDSLERVSERVSARRQKTIKTPKISVSVPKVQISSKIRTNNTEVLRRLIEKNQWIQVLNDEILGPRCITAYTNIQYLFVDLQMEKLKNSKSISYLPNRFWIKSLFFKIVRAIYLNQFFVLGSFFYLWGSFFYFIIWFFPVISSWISSIYESQSFINLLDSFWNFIASLREPEPKPRLDEPELEPIKSSPNVIFVVGGITLAIVMATITFYLYSKNK